MEPEESSSTQKETMNLFAYLLLRKDENISPDEKVNLHASISSFASQEELVDFEEKLKSQGICATFIRKCDGCQKNLSHAPKETDFTCQRCGFVNDLCEACQYFQTFKLKYHPRRLKKCMKGVGCRDFLKITYSLVQAHKVSQEAPF